VHSPPPSGPAQEDRPPRLLLVTAQGDAWRLLNALPSAYAVGASTLEPGVQWLGATTAVFTLKRDFIPPPYTEGILRAVFEAAKVKGFQVRTRQTQPLAGEYDLKWE